jgi:hypothetical protein
MWRIAAICSQPDYPVVGRARRPHALLLYSKYLSFDFGTFDLVGTGKIAEVERTPHPRQMIFRTTLFHTVCPSCYWARV